MSTTVDIPNEAKYGLSIFFNSSQFKRRVKAPTRNIATMKL